MSSSRVLFGLEITKALALLLGLSTHAHGAIHQHLASQTVIVGLLAKGAILKIRPIGQIFYPFHNFDNTGGTLAIATAVHHFAVQLIDINAVLDRLDSQVGTGGGDYVLVFVNEVNSAHRVLGKGLADRA